MMQQQSRSSLQLNPPMGKASLASKNSLSNLKPSQINLKKMFVNGKANTSGTNSVSTQQPPPSTNQKNQLEDQSIIQDREEQP